MTAQRIRFAQRYKAGLRKHLLGSGRTSFEVAAQLGGQAATLGLGTLALARIHDQTIAALQLPKRPLRIRQQTDAFFARAVALVENTRRRLPKPSDPLRRIRKALRARTRDLADSDRRLQRKILDRKALEAVLKTKRNDRTELSKESQRMQQRLRQLNRQVLSALEKERAEISGFLHHEMAQTLVGITVRLAMLKAEAALTVTSLNKQIASTQRLVINSTKTMQRFAGELEGRHAP